MPLSVGNATAAVARHIEQPLNLSASESVYAISEMVDEAMASAARIHAIEWGRSISKRTMIAFGGAAPLHAARLAEKLDIDHVVVPTNAGVGSAIGFLGAPVAFDVVRSRYMRLSAFDADVVAEIFAEMYAEAEAIVRAGSSPAATLHESRTAAMRYVGQGHEIVVELPLGDVQAAALRDLFDEAYRRHYSLVMPDIDIEVLSWTLTLSTDTEWPAAASASRGRGRRSTAASGPGRCSSPAISTTLESAVYARSDLAPGMSVGGPALDGRGPDDDRRPARFHRRGRCPPLPALAPQAMTGTRLHRAAVATDAFREVDRQIMWNRLLAVVEEQAQTLVRTAFSTSVREAGDLSAGVFDRHGRMLAQAVTGTPGHVNAMAGSVAHFLDKFPLATMHEGDAFVTNDPWYGTGHLNDFTVVTPTFVAGRPVALFAATVHVVDVGGLGFGPDGHEVFEEGINIPIMPLFVARQAQPTAVRDSRRQRPRASPGRRRPLFADGLQRDRAASACARC